MVHQNNLRVHIREKDIKYIKINIVHESMQSWKKRKKHALSILRWESIQPYSHKQGSRNTGMRVFLNGKVPFRQAEMVTKH